MALKVESGPHPRQLFRFFKFKHPRPQIMLNEVSAGLIEPFHSRNQRLCKFIGAKESFYVRKGSTFKGLVWGINTTAVF